MAKPKILHLVNHYAPCIGGIENMVKGLCENLVKEGFDAEVVCLNRCANSCIDLPPHETISGVVVNRLPFVDLHYYKIAPAVMNFLKNADLVHIHGLGFFSDLLLSSKFIHKKPIVISTHGGIGHTKSFTTLKAIYFKHLNKVLLKNANKVCACSKGDLEIFSEVCNNLVLIENGVNTETYSKVVRVPERDSFIFVGRFSKNKRLDNLLKAFVFVVSKAPRAKLRIVGEDFDNILPELLQLVKGLHLEKNVEFVGKIEAPEKVAELYGKTEFFISASEYEGFGIAAVEAMAAGCIPILNDIPPFRTFVESAYNGLIVDFDNPANAAKKILELMSLSEMKLSNFSSNSRQLAQRFSWRNKVREFISVYTKLLNG